MLKILFLCHRWLGIVLGLVMVLWCLSGFIMMYKPYPELTEAQQLGTQPSLVLDDCCVSSPAIAEPVQRFSLRMLGDVPVLRVFDTLGRWQDHDASTGLPLAALTREEAGVVADRFAADAGLPAGTLTGVRETDQWTVYGAYNPWRPFYHYASDDAAGHEWYVSQRSGEILQYTTREQRVWGYLGAVIHWLYPTLLRQHVTLWSQTVIWLTIFGLFLVLTGLYFGVKQYRHRRTGRRSPYRGLSAWHHYAGLVFGVLVLTWTLSGLFSMNPWGLMEGEGAGREQALLRGGTVAPATLAQTLQRLEAATLPPGTVTLEGVPLLGRLELFAVNREAQRQRLDPHSLAPAPLPSHTLPRLAALLSPDVPPREAMLLEHEDAYYYNHHTTVQLPAWRVVTGNEAATRYYLDPDSGALLSKVDTDRRWYRWLHYGLHRGDFSALARSRPVWDLFMWVLMLGVTLICATGFWMGVRRLYK